jgi:hypothetical protein
MSFSFREGEHPALIVGQDGILRAGWQPAPAGLFTKASGGLSTRRRLPTCPTTSAEFPFARKLNDIELKHAPPMQRSPRPSLLPFIRGLEFLVPISPHAPLRP